MDKLKRYLYDIYPFFIPVLLCIIVFLLPSSWQEKLIFSHSTLNWWNWFTYIFTHETLTHLIGNMIIYSVAICLSYLILPGKERENSWLLIIIMLLLTPLVTVFLEMLFIPNMQGFSRGFSAIAAGTLGILCFAISRRIHIIFGNDPKKMSLLTSSYLIFIPSLAFLVWNLSHGLFAVASLLWVSLVVLIIYNAKQGKITSVNVPNMKDSLKICLGIIVLLLGMPLLVPVVLKQTNGSVVDILAHFLGFLIGFFLMFFKVSSNFGK